VVLTGADSNQYAATEVCTRGALGEAAASRYRIMIGEADNVARAIKRGISEVREKRIDDHDAFFSAYVPQADDGCYLPDDITVDVGTDGAVCWFHLSCGRVLGVHGGMVLEYDPSTLAPLGLVVAKDELAGRQLAVVDSGLDGGVSKTPGREQAVILYDDEMNVTVVQPNEDGSYWRKIVRNKVVRMKEKRREKAAVDFIKKTFKVAPDVIPIKSSWGPYISTVGTAKGTSVPGVTSNKAASAASASSSKSED
jgi:hypothetical protein